MSWRKKETKNEKLFKERVQEAIDECTPVIYHGYGETDWNGGGKDGPVVQYREKLLEAFLAVPDQPFCNGKAEGAPPTVLVNNDEGQMVSASLAQLETLGKPAECGRGEETVTDPSVRSTTVIKPPAVAVQWPGLNAALESVRRQHTCGPLRAELHDVLVYREHDFFKEHRDSKKMPQHIMTLVVECSVPVVHDKDGKDARMTPAGGSLLRFFHDIPFRKDREYDEHSGLEDDGWNPDANSSDGNESVDTSSAASTSSSDLSAYESLDDYDYPVPPRLIKGWRGRKPGDWCCWYCTQPHEVLPLNREGVRVAAVYNIMACGSDAVAVAGAEDHAEVAVEDELTAPEPCRGALGNVPQDVVGVIGEYLDLEANQSVCRTHPYLAFSVSPARVLRTRMERLIRHLQDMPKLGKDGTPLDHVGFLLWHPYARDVPPAQVPDRMGQLPPPLQVPPEHLRGRDIFLVDALRQATGQMPSLIQTHVIMEVPADLTDGSRARILHMPLDVLPSNLDHNPEHQPIKKQSEYDQDFECYELDSRPSVPAVTRKMPPLVQGFPTKYAARLREDRCPERRWTNLWGNQSTFSFYWYRTVMAVVSLSGNDPKTSFEQLIPEVKPKTRGW